MKISIIRVQNKADPLIAVLKAGGHDITGWQGGGETLLLDHDLAEYGRDKIIKAFARQGKPVYLYPHGAAPILLWDGIHEPNQNVNGNLVTSAGHAEIMSMYGYPLPTHVIGWYLCPLLPFRPLEEKRILFGPVHPVKGHKHMYPEDVEANRHVYERLLSIPDVRLRVRYIGDLETNGLWREFGVQYVQGKTDNTFIDIDDADVVISNGTLAWMAIARGKPVIMLQQGTVARDLAYGQVMRARRYDEYCDFLRYPFDVENGDDLQAIIREACRHEPVEWKQRFIGAEMDPGQFCNLLERLIEKDMKRVIYRKTRFRTDARRAGRHFYISRHQGKERAYMEALSAAGYGAKTSIAGHLKFGLVDLDNWRNGSHELVHKPVLERLRAIGVPVFLYPHAARPMAPYDGIMRPWPHIRCMFTIASGHVEIMSRISYPAPVEAAGWPFCGIRPFEPVAEVRRILFGPIHPAVTGWISKVDRDINRRTYERLLAYCKATGAQLTVRHIQSMKRNGLWKEKGINYISARADGSTREIDQADLVVGHQTFAWLAVARGKPTLMMAEDTPPRSGSSDRNFAYVRSWEKYADYLMYPLDILAGDTAEMIAQACKRNAKVTAWRKRFIGEPFDPGKFVEQLENYL